MEGEGETWRERERCETFLIVAPDTRYDVPTVSRFLHMRKTFLLHSQVSDVAETFVLRWTCSGTISSTRAARCLASQIYLALLRSSTTGKQKNFWD